jgi:hypothetical protein
VSLYPNTSEVEQQVYSYSALSRARDTLIQTRSSRLPVDLDKETEQNAEKTHFDCYAVTSNVPQTSGNNTNIQLQTHERKLPMHRQLDVGSNSRLVNHNHYLPPRSHEVDIPLGEQQRQQKREYNNKNGMNSFLTPIPSNALPHQQGALENFLTYNDTDIRGVTTGSHEVVPSLGNTASTMVRTVFR